MDQNQTLNAVMGSLLPRLRNSDFNRIESQDCSFLTPDPNGLSNAIINQLTNQCTDHSGNALEVSIFKLLESDLCAEFMFEQVFAPVARELGDRWLSDQISFVDVHLGALKLRSIADAIQHMLPVGAFDTSPSAALSATPGDQHTLGIALAAGALAQRGWQVSNFTGLSSDEWFFNIRANSYDLVGLSLHVDSHFDSLCDSISRLRSDNTTSSILVTVSGDFFVRNPRSIELCGADAYVSTIEETCQLVHARVGKNAATVIPTESFPRK